MPLTVCCSWHGCFSRFQPPRLLRRRGALQFFGGGGGRSGRPPRVRPHPPPARGAVPLRLPLRPPHALAVTLLGACLPPSLLFSLGSRCRALFQSQRSARNVTGPYSVIAVLINVIDYKCIAACCTDGRRGHRPRRPLEWAVSHGWF